MMLRAIRWCSLIYNAVCVSSLIIFMSQLLAAISALRIKESKTKQNKTKTCHSATDRWVFEVIDGFIGSLFLNLSKRPEQFPA